VVYNVVGTKFNTNSKRSALITNTDNFVAAILGTTGSGASLLDTLRLQVNAELERHKLTRQGRLPANLIDARLKQLDQMESALNKMPKSPNRS